MDVVYVIAASADRSIFEGGGAEAVTTTVQSLVDYYYDCLCKGGFEGLTKEVFMQQIKYAWIDLTRVILGDHWSSLTCEIVESRKDKMSFNAYNKCAVVGRAVMEVANVYLNDLGI